MSHFYGTLQGNRGAATRQGTIHSGFSAVAASWDGCIIRVKLYHNKDTGADRFLICQDSWHGHGVYEVLAEGELGKRTVKKATKLEQRVRAVLLAAEEFAFSCSVNHEPPSRDEAATLSIELRQVLATGFGELVEKKKEKCPNGHSICLSPGCWLKEKKLKKGGK